MIRLACLTGVLLLAAAAPYAAETRPANSPRPATPVSAMGLTLREAEAMLLERNLAVAAARQGIDIARAQRLVADTAPSPTLGYSQTAGQMNEGGRLRDPNGARAVSPLNNAALSLSATIERGGKRELRTRLAAEQVSVAEAHLLDVLRGQVFTLRQAFIQGLQARANLDVALANRTALDRTEGLLRRQFRDGQIAEGDVLRFQASRLPFEQDLAAAAQSYVAAAAQVAAQLGLDATRPGAAAPAPGILAPVPFDLRGRLDRGTPLGLTREQLAEALPMRPDVLAAGRGASAAEANTALAEAGRYRDLTLNGSLNRTELSQDLPSTSRATRASDTIGLGVSIPIFTRRLTEASVAVASAQQSQARSQAAQALGLAQADLATAWASHVQAGALVQLTAGQALRRAEEAYRSTEAAYQAGGRTLLDVLDALRTLNATRVSANAARAAEMLALATLEQASGVSGIAAPLQ